MARASQLQNKTVRDDPPETMIRPDDQNLSLVAADGKNLVQDEVGYHDGKFQYCWVNAANQQQFVRYQARGYEVCRYNGNHAKPRFKFFQQDEETADDAVIKRGEMVLMCRTLEKARQEMAYAKRTNIERLKMMGKATDDLQRRARRGGMYIHEQSIQDVER